MTWIEPLFGSVAMVGQATGVLLASYLLGCFSTGYYFIRFRTGQDLHELGSGSVGAKNVGRLLGPRGFAVTLFGDAAKAALAVWLARHFTGHEWLVMLAAFGVVLGHIWPVQLRFRGGKGVATMLGAMLVYDYRLVLIFAVLTGVAFVLLRNSVLNGLVAFALLPVVCLSRGDQAVTTVGIAGLSALVLFAHRKNLAEELAAGSARRHIQPNPNLPSK